MMTTQLTQVGLEYGMKAAYDPFGRRISKTIVSDGIGTLCTAPNSCPRTTTYVYDNQNIILEYDNSNNIQTRYTHGPNIDEPLAIEIKNTTTFTTYYYHADGLGSITALSNSSGDIVQRYEYDSFGNQTITVNGNIASPYTFTSREYDNETGMYFYRARYYDSKVGRFVTKDPISFTGGDVNLYAYVKNNPGNFTDPEGLAGTLPFGVPFAIKAFINYQIVQPIVSAYVQDSSGKRIISSAISGAMAYGTIGTVGGAVFGGTSGMAIGAIPGALIGGIGGTIAGFAGGLLSGTATEIAKPIVSEAATTIQKKEVELYLYMQNINYESSSCSK